jgi:hypothetical protein
MPTQNELALEELAKAAFSSENTLRVREMVPSWAGQKLVSFVSKYREQIVLWFHDDRNRRYLVLWRFESGVYVAVKRGELTNGSPTWTPTDNILLYITPGEGYELADKYRYYGPGIGHRLKTAGSPEELQGISEKAILENVIRQRKEEAWYQQKPTQGSGESRLESEQYFGAGI